ncbi:hypothetical protein MASR1M90_07560 [Desulfovibrionales bacterium]
MRSLVFDEISPDDMKKLETWLIEQDLQSPIEHLYHFTLPTRLLTPTQQEHADQCGPFHMAVETGRDWVRLELLVVPKAVLRCACIAYATPEQRAHMENYLENLFRDLDIAI